MKNVLLGCAFALLSSTSVFAQPKSDPRKAGWLSDYAAAKAEAKRTGKPILIIFRCEPCPECRDFDERVIRLDQEIAGVAGKFVKARQVRINGVDLRLFEFDYDLTWIAFFLNADEHVYGRYGGRDAGDAESRLSLAGLRFAMEKALEAHKNPPKAQPPAEKPLRVEDFAAARRIRGNCVHCHNVKEFRRAELMSEGKWDSDAAWVYPLPENIGITLDIDRGNKVKSVAENSPASKAGIIAGDALNTLNSIPVASFADASFGLQRAPKVGSIPITWLRDGKEHSAKLKVVEGWRKTNLSWRPSMFEQLPRLEFSGDDLTSEEKRDLGIPEKRFAFRQDKFVHSTLKAVGVRKGDIFIGLDGKEFDGTMEGFLGFLHANYLAGEKATLNLLRDGKRVDIAMTLK
jgi:serine protease Do